MNKKYIKYFALIMILVFPISCAKIVPTKKRKKPSRVIIRKPSKEEILKKPEPRKKKETKRAKKIIPGLPAILPTYFNKKNGSDMAYLHGGNFIMGDNLGEKNERPAAKVYVPAFFIDIYEITNAQYKAFNN
ncbi:MAG TPA: SUMF1/EgtB/PvdO family nonheme iron enzyme, partial [Nitrospinota bacterium]|nr:SUMF1/EgtB/PvdO family nonheme iron enzyme [Nitrospinota bacterium]